MPSPRTCDRCGSQEASHYVYVVDLDQSVCNGCGELMVSTPIGVFSTLQAYNDWENVFMPEYDDDPDYEEDPPYREGLSSYHDINRSTTILKNVDWSDNSLLGVELELDAHTDNYDAFTRKNVLCEGDGSLSDETGVEFIFRPFPYSQIRQDDGVFHNILKDIQNICDDNRESHYGCHISINGAPMTPDHQFRFAKFFHCTEKLSTYIGGRKANRYCRFYPFEPWREIYHFDDKYLAAAYRGSSRIELRFFKATTDWTKLKVYFEYTWAVWNYTKTCGETCLTEERFKEWLSSPVVLVDYPNLAEVIACPVVSV